MNDKGSQTNIFKWIKKYEEKKYNYAVRVQKCKKIQKIILGTFSKKLLKIGELLSEFKTWPLKVLNLFIFIFNFVMILKKYFFSKKCKKNMKNVKKMNFFFNVLFQLKNIF